MVARVVADSWYTLPSRQIFPDTFRTQVNNLGNIVVSVDKSLIVLYIF